MPGEKESFDEEGATALLIADSAAELSGCVTFHVQPFRACHMIIPRSPACENTDASNNQSTCGARVRSIVFSKVKSVCALNASAKDEVKLEVIVTCETELADRRGRKHLCPCVSSVTQSVIDNMVMRTTCHHISNSSPSPPVTR